MSLDVFMAFCKLKLKEYTECINYCQQSLAINKTNPKAYFRWCEALIGMGNFEESKEKCLKSQKLCIGEYKKLKLTCDKQLNKINSLIKQQKDKQKRTEKIMSENIRNRLKS